MNPVADNSMHIPFKDKIQVHLDDSEGEPSGFDVKAFRVVDRMNELFHIEVVARSANPDIDLESRIGKPARFQVEAPMTPGKPITRNWSGICVDFAQTQVEPNGLSTYRIEIRPMLWQLSQRRNHRLFQHMSVVDIAGQLLDEWGVEHLLKVDAESYPKLELRVQYGETDYDFFERLLEENGIAYYFDEAGGESSKVVLSDAPETREAREAKLDYLDKTFAAENNEVEYATELTLRHRVQPGAIAYRDHDYRRPSLDLKGVADAGAEKEARFEHYIYHPGDFLHDEGAGGNTPTADDKGTARHDEKRGQLRAQRTLEAKRVRKRIVTFRTSVIDLSPGITFAIGGHPRGDMGETLLATALEMWAGEEEPWTMVNEAVFASSPYRPEELTPKPRIFGVQTATVVGPSGEEIYTDEYGRVRVQFPWDREGKMDEGSSCWMRVSQGWAGSAFGGLFVPRIGQEVLVSFLDGDTDQPIIVGRVYNEASPVPYKLPENKTVSTFKSDSSPRNGGFNELRFEDAAGRELIYMQAQKDWSSLVKNDQMHVVGNNSSTLIRGEESSATAGSNTRLVQKSDSETVGQSRTTIIGQSRNTTVGDTDTSFVGKLFSVTIARQLEKPLAKTFGAAYTALAPVLASSPVSTLGQVPTSPLGLPFSGSELGPMNALAQMQLPQLMGLAGVAPKSLAEDKGPPATGITMVDKHITLTTGGASIILNGEDIIIAAAGEIRMQAKKDNKIFSEEADVVIQGGPMVKINPGIKPPAATCMKGAAKEGAAFIGGALP